VWGKWAQNQNKTQTKIVNSEKVLLAFNKSDADLWDRNTSSETQEAEV
jgi:hypothetical protein